MGAGINQINNLVFPPRSSFWMLLREVLSNFCRNLTIRHLVDCFTTYDASAKVDSFKTYLQFTFCLTKTEYHVDSASRMLVMTAS